MDKFTFDRFIEACDKYAEVYKVFAEKLAVCNAMTTGVKKRIQAEMEADGARIEELKSLLSSNASLIMQRTWESELAQLTGKNYEKSSAESLAFQEAYNEASAALGKVTTAENSVSDAAKAAIEAIKTEKNHFFSIVPGGSTLHMRLSSAHNDFYYNS